MTRKAQPGRLEKALLETADDMRRAGVLEKAPLRKITLRHLGNMAATAAEPITGEEIRSMRERARLGQAVFARSQEDRHRLALLASQIGMAGGSRRSSMQQANRSAKPSRLGCSPLPPAIPS